MIIHGAAATRLADRRNADAQTIQHPRRRGAVGVGRQARLNATFQQQHLARMTGVRAKAGRVYRCRQLAGQGLWQQWPELQAHAGQGSEQSGVGDDPTQAFTQHAFGEWPRDQVFNRRAADVQQVVVIHAGRAGGFAVATAQAAVQMQTGFLGDRLTF